MFVIVIFTFFVTLVFMFAEKIHFWYKLFSEINYYLVKKRSPLFLTDNRPVNEWHAIGLTHAHTRHVQEFIWRVNHTSTLQQKSSVILLQISHLQLYVEFPFAELHCFIIFVINSFVNVVQISISIVAHKTQKYVCFYNFICKTFLKIYYISCPKVLLV